MDRQQNLAEIFTVLFFIPKRKTKAGRDQSWTAPFTRCLANAGRIMPHEKIRSRLPRSSTPAVSHRARLSVCVRPDAQIVPPSGLHDMRIAPREYFSELKQMIDPPSPVTRWTSRRKAAVVAAVRSGEITLEAACWRYELSIAR